MTVVLDTNVLVAALVAEGLCREVVHRVIRMRGVATSRPLLDELDATLRRKFTVTPATAAFLKAFRELVRVVDPAPLEQAVSRDPDDDIVLATAVAAGANLIVTGDDDLLVLGTYAGIAIVSPRRLLEMLDSGR
ncbi:MAG: putative toxin-antitoxin system toxin component, PIN family [Acidobacteria bacterium]|nr:putative toxin-antitoxin system toxin component, PIN family [Acidobacteriota bacterium]